MPPEGGRFVQRSYSVAGSSDGDTDPWPAFVDVLTTVIMVITFVLVIMSAAIMELSKRVIAEITAAHKTEMAEAGGAPAQGKDVKTGGAAAASANAMSTEVVQSPREAADGSSVSQLGGILRQDQVVNGEERLSIRTRETDETLKLKVAAEERPTDEQKGAEVQTADTLIRIDFEPSAARINQEVEQQIADFVKQQSGKYANAKFEIWSFAPQAGSVTEAERMAFYRAILTRNVLVKSGIAPSRISTQVRVSDPVEQAHVVRVVVKP
jgi:outer membrane protein OmpA-like peptidoglycan-associated protein